MPEQQRRRRKNEFARSKSAIFESRAINSLEKIATISTYAHKRASDFLPGLKEQRKLASVANQLASLKHTEMVNQFKLRRLSMETKGSAALVRTEQNRAVENIRFLFSPSDPWIRLWELLILTLVCMQGVIIPFSIAFRPAEMETTSWKNFELCVDFLFLGDVCLQFNLAQPRKDGSLITSRKQLAIRYLKLWFWIDFLSSVPVELVMAMAGQEAEQGGFDFLKGLKLPKLIRLLKLLRLFRMVRLNPNLKRWLQYSRHTNLLRLTRLLFFVLALTHYMACMWQAVMSQQWQDMRLNRDPVEDAEPSTTTRYIAAFYAILLNIMGSDTSPLTNGEKLFTCFAIFTGAVTMAVVFGNVAVLIANFTANSNNYQKKMEHLFESMEHMRLPRSLQERIHCYYDYLWDKHHSLDGEVSSFIPELSANLASEVLLFLRTDLLTSAPFFKSVPPEVIQSLVMQLELEVYLPNDYVIRVGELGTEMYFIQDGMCVATINLTHQSVVIGGGYVRGEEKVVKILHPGDSFGDMGLLMDSKRTANVRAKTYCQLVKLSRAVFNEAAANSAELRTTVEEQIKRAGYTFSPISDDGDGEQVDGKGGNGEGNGGGGGDGDGNGGGDGDGSSREEEEEANQDQYGVEGAVMGTGAGEGAGAGAGAGAGVEAAAVGSAIGRDSMLGGGGTNSIRGGALPGRSSNRPVSTLMGVGGRHRSSSILHQMPNASGGRRPPSFVSSLASAGVVVGEGGAAADAPLPGGGDPTKEIPGIPLRSPVTRFSSSVSSTEGRRDPPALQLRVETVARAQEGAQRWQHRTDARLGSMEGLLQKIALAVTTTSSSNGNGGDAPGNGTGDGGSSGGDGDGGGGDSDSITTAPDEVSILTAATSALAGDGGGGGSGGNDDDSSSDDPMLTHRILDSDKHRDG